MRRHESGVRCRVTAKTQLNGKIKIPHSRESTIKGVISRESLGGHACYGHAAMVMWLYGRAYQLERKLHGGGRKENGEEQRREKQKKKFNIRETSQQIAFILMKKALRHLCQTSP